MDIGSIEKESIYDSLSNLVTLKNAYDLGYKFKNEKEMTLYLPIADSTEGFYFANSNFVFTMLELLIGDITADTLTPEGLESYFDFPDDMVNELKDYELGLFKIKVTNKNLSRRTLESIVSIIGQGINDAFSESLFCLIPTADNILASDLCYLSLSGDVITTILGDELYELAQIDVDKIIKTIKEEI